MTYIEIFVLILVIAMVASGIFLLKRTASKFNLSPEQLEKIKKRNEMLDNEDKD